MRTRSFVVLLTVTLVLGALIGGIESGTVSGAARFAMLAVLVIPIAFLIVRVDGRPKI